MDDDHYSRKMASSRFFFLICFVVCVADVIVLEAGFSAKMKTSKILQQVESMLDLSLRDTWVTSG